MVGQWGLRLTFHLEQLDQKSWGNRRDAAVWGLASCSKVGCCLRLRCGQRAAGPSLAPAVLEVTQDSGVRDWAQVLAAGSWQGLAIASSLAGDGQGAPQFQRLAGRSLMAHLQTNQISHSQSGHSRCKVQSPLFYRKLPSARPVQLAVQSSVPSGKRSSNCCIEQIWRQMETIAASSCRLPLHRFA